MRLSPLAALAGLALATLATAADAGSYVLEKAVLLSRHGIRSPLEPNSDLNQLSNAPWPNWPVPSGYLTPHGREAVARLGAFYRQAYADRGLLPKRGCPAPDGVFVWSDAMQRTIATGNALLEGAFPGCALRARHLTINSSDPLFSGGLCRVNTNVLGRALRGRIGGDLNAVVAACGRELETMQSVLGCCGPEVCAHYGLPAGCKLTDIPSTLEDGFHISGPLAIGQDLAENFLLEYAEGKPMSEVAFGRAGPQTIAELGRLYTTFYDLDDRTPYIAARTASNLAHHILADLREAAEADPARRPQGRRLVIYVGHDGNISGVAGLLNLDWALPGYQPNQTPPAGALAFELLRDTETGKRFVQVAFYTQTPDQMRELAPLSLQNPPLRAEIAVPRCTVEADGIACPWERFAQIVDAAIDPACVGNKD